MSKSKKIAFLLLILIILASVYLVNFAKLKIHSYLEKALKTNIHIGRISFSIFKPGIILEDITIEDLLSVEQATIRPGLVTLDKPRLTLQITKSAKTNFQLKLPVKELLIKDGILTYASAELHGIFIHIKNYPSPVSYIQDIPLFTRIKGRAHLPTDPKGVITFSGNLNMTEAKTSFSGNISMDNISITYFNNLYPKDSQIKVTSGEFSLKAQARCIRDELLARPDVIVKDLRLKITQDYATGDVFELPVALVVDFFDLYKEELKFTFEISGSLSNPEFKLGRVISEQVSAVIGTSIVRTIASSPALIAKLGDKLITIADKLKKFGLEIGKGAGKAIKQLGKPAKELIKGMKGE